MPSGRSSAAQGGRARRRTQTPVARRSDRVRGGKTVPKDSGKKRPGGKSAARPRSGASTGGAFKLSSTRRASVLALLVCTMALSVSVPLRTYMSQRDELAARKQEKAELVRQISELEERKAKLADPEHVEAEARSRLGLVRPGEIPYIVQVPSDQPAAPQPTEKQGDGIPWYEQMWKSLTGKDS